VPALACPSERRMPFAGRSLFLACAVHRAGRGSRLDSGRASRSHPGFLTPDGFAPASFLAKGPESPTVNAVRRSCRVVSLAVRT
jgi:hypothetical protein